MKLVHVTSGADGESHAQERALDFTERNGLATATEAAATFSFRNRRVGPVNDYHLSARRQYMLYITASVEIGFGDGSSVILEPGDVLLAEDMTGRGHTTRVLKDGISAFVELA